MNYDAPTGGSSHSHPPWQVGADQTLKQMKDGKIKTEIIRQQIEPIRNDNNACMV
jgi:hypothetical protein